MLSKPELRKAARARRAELARALPDFAERIAGFAGELDLPQAAVLAFYWPVREEADPRPLAGALAARGHALALPRIVAKDKPLAFHCWTPSDATLVNAFGITEPLHESPHAMPSVVLVPMLAFDSEGFRLGYGAGYYDRTLEALSTVVALRAIGIAYAGQEMPQIPRKPHDMRLDAVLTENGLRRFHHT